MVNGRLYGRAFSRLRWRRFTRSSRMMSEGRRRSIPIIAEVGNDGREDLFAPSTWADHGGSCRNGRRFGTLQTPVERLSAVLILIGAQKSGQTDLAGRTDILSPPAAERDRLSTRGSPPYPVSAFYFADLLYQRRPECFSGRNSEERHRGEHTPAQGFGLAVPREHSGARRTIGRPLCRRMVDYDQINRGTCAS